MQNIAPLILAVVTLAVFYGIRWYFRNQHVKMRQEHAQLDGWTKMSVKLGMEVWVCPRCAESSYMWNFAQKHMDPAVSPCAFMAEHGEALAAILALYAARPRTGGGNQEYQYQYSASAVHIPDPDPEPGESDPELTEIDAMEERGARFRALMDRNK